ncbi:hypothetical protein BDN70DRAFT_873931 [Pholiota conissans]|uniref:Cytochrome c oxidase assembly protein COX20, mitochondrial n=1 Tax=Pholiota conissans TaxID=109636 RepID=A0A9P5Z9I7_9AGAR|nr:hypothetical protein BDN70DRAFT_873931 [Pholiota conissans]
MADKPEPLPQVQTLPSRLPPPTGNIVVDSFQSARHITEVPCARNAFLTGIAGGLGVGIIRGLSTNALRAGHWAMGTFLFLSASSWHVCQWRFEQERRQLTKMMETMRKRPVKDNSDQPPEASNTTAP